MAQFINSNKEFFWGDWYFKDHVMPADFDYKAHKKELSPFYQEQGFKVSMMFADFFSRMSGTVSDRYLSMDVYYFYVIPALNRYDFKDAYLDKNIYSRLFPNVLQPETIIKNIHGHCYAQDEEITLAQAVELVQQAQGELMIKPTVETCNGDGVDQLRDFSTEALTALFTQYDINFIVQGKVRQHPVVASLNPTSLNTMRIFTYRKADGEIVSLTDYNFLRFGGDGACKDNSSSGGGWCHVKEDGMLDDKIYRFKQLTTESLKQVKGITSLCVPGYQDALDMVIGMHKRLPYFDFVGWDVAINEEGKPVFIEYNLVPSIEGPQMMTGPMFGPYLDEVLERVKRVRCSKAHAIKKEFDKGSIFYLHMQ